MYRFFCFHVTFHEFPKICNESTLAPIEPKKTCPEITHTFSTTTKLKRRIFFREQTPRIGEPKHGLKLHCSFVTFVHETRISAFNTNRLHSTCHELVILFVGLVRSCTSDSANQDGRDDLVTDVRYLPHGTVLRGQLHVSTQRLLVSQCPSGGWREPWLRAKPNAKPKPAGLLFPPPFCQICAMQGKIFHKS